MVSGLFSIYLPSVGIKLSFVSFFLMLSGWLFGPLYGAFSGFLSTVSFLFDNQHNQLPILFVLQPIAIGFISGLFGKMRIFGRVTATLAWVFMMLLTASALAFVRSHDLKLALAIFLFLAVNLGLFIFGKKYRKNSLGLYVNLLMSFITIALVVSCLMGTIATLQYQSNLDANLVLKSRIFKEIFKISLFIIPLMSVIYPLKGVCSADL